jgi:hypothetical protein
MPVTVRERVILGLIASLEAIDNPDYPGLKVYRNRRTVTEFPALSVLDGDQAPLGPATGISHYAARPVVQGFVKDAEGGDPAPALNGLYGVVLKHLLNDAIAEADSPLGQVALDVSEGELLTFIDPEGDADRQGQFDLTVNIEFMTRENDPFSLPDEA